MNKYSILIIWFWVPFLSLRGQTFSFRWDNSIPVEISEQVLPNAWAGGINAGQYSKMHLNQDGVEDLVIFDRTTSKISTYLAEKTNDGGLFRYAPEYEFFFPKDLRGWFLLRDYDGDGRKDIFTHTQFGIKVYHNNTPEGQLLVFEKVADPLNTTGYRGEVNLQVNVMDIPSIVDLDDDGDLDIITFDFAQGSFLEYHQNQSQEKYKDATHLEFIRTTTCWGGVMEGKGCGEFTFGIDCEKGEIGGGGSEKPDRVLHVGSTITVLDLNGDAKKDVLIGDVSCAEIYVMYNKGSNGKPVFRKADSTFPKEHPIQFPVFPAVFYEDLDLDGKKDLLASPNVFFNEGKKIDFQQSGWLYKNIRKQKKTKFQFQQQNFLQNTMIDLGGYTSPALWDYDDDGDLDLLVGNEGTLHKSGFYATLFLFENKGTTSSPDYILKEEDYLTLSKFHLNDIQPLVVDCNQDGKKDLFFTAYQHHTRTAVAKYRLSGYESEDWKDWMEIKLFFRDVPYFFDVNRDGKLDILIGRGRGNLAYYQFKEGNYELINENLGGIKANSSKRSLRVEVGDINQDGQADLITSDASGNLVIYANFQKNINQTWIADTDFVFNPVAKRLTGLYLGTATYPLLQDINEDNYPDLLLGTRAGGIHYLKNTTQYFLSAVLTKAVIELNHTENFLYVTSSETVIVKIYNKSGEKILSQGFTQASIATPFDLNGLGESSFLVELTDENGQKITKKMTLKKK